MAMTPKFCNGDRHSKSPARRAVVQYLLPTFLVLPYAYLGLLLAVAIHEFVGHGLTAIMVGGSFTGVQLEFDGMGWAQATAPPDAATWKYTAVMAGGVISTMVAGIILLSLGWRTRRQPWIALPLLAIAANQILEGAPYLFWNAVHPVPPGDIAAIVSGQPLARVACIIFGGTVMLAGVWCSMALLMWIAESWLNEGKRYLGWSRFTALTVLGFSGVAWFTFDWDQLAPGLAAWPNVVGLFIHLISAASIAPARWRIERSERNVRCTLISATAGWALVLFAIVVVGVWLRKGLTW